VPGIRADRALTWQQVKDKFEADNPNLRAGQLNIQESKAEEITAYLRPNPNLTAGLDQLEPFTGSPYRPFAYTFPLVAFDYLHERQHKRELRLESAQKGTAIAESQQLDLERTLLFNLRSAFVQTLQAKALLANAKENLDYFDKELTINRVRFKAGDIARVDLDRLVLQRAQYESDYQTAHGQRQNREDHAADAAQRPHAGGSIRRGGAVRIPGAVMPLDEFRPWRWRPGRI
jgi:outer membrane protein, heavy metal efflux system